ncbi:glycosyltransferase [Flavihumibacter sp.]|uniref:glycosyltransferase n=1 Tax=Flavihumibacter sp. TaxID=1913981 RepID=UPI002FC8B876
MAKIAGIVILYNPDEEVVQNIQTYSSHINKLYIADNSKIPAIGNKYSDANFEYIHDSHNHGIAKRLNQVANLAIHEGFDFLLTMDQDSAFTDSDIEKYISCIDKISWDNVAMAGVNFEIKNPSPNPCSFIDTVELITSGSIVNLRLYKSIGGFDENLFIDEVDHDYCFSAIKSGYRIVKLENIHIQHKLGKVSFHKSLLNLKTTPRVLHSPIRLYYMTRNHLYICNKHKGYFKNELELKRNELLNRIKNNLLYGKHKFLTLRLIMKGIIDFKKKVMGNYLNN